MSESGDSGREVTGLIRVLSDAANGATSGAVAAALEAAGVLGGAAAGGALAGPAGASAGAAAGRMAGGIAGRFTGEFADFVVRQLSAGEKQRVVTASAWAFDEIDRLRAAGGVPRDELDGEIGDQSSSQEVYEGAMMIARDSYEQRRVRHLGTLSARFAFERGIDAAQGHFLLRAAEALSYRQYCLLHILGGQFSVRLVRDDFRSRDMRSGPVSYNPREPLPDLAAVLQEAFDLVGRGLLVRSDESALLDISDVNPGLMRATPIGAHLAALLDVAHTDPAEHQLIFELLNRRGALWNDDREPPHAVLAGR